MFCSDEEIPCVEPVTKYKLTFSRDCGEDRLIVKRIPMEPKYVTSPKKEHTSKNNKVNNSPQRHAIRNTPASVRGVNLSAEKKPSMRKSGEKLNDQSITDILCDSESSFGSESEDENSEYGSQKSQKSSEAREKWIASLRNDDLSSVSANTKDKISSKSSRKKCVPQNIYDDQKRTVTSKKNISRIGDKEVLNESKKRTLYSQRECKSEYNNSKRDVGSPSQFNNRSVNKKLSVDAVESNKKQSSSDEDSLECVPLKRKKSNSRFKSKSKHNAVEWEVKTNVQTQRAKRLIRTPSGKANESSSKEETANSSAVSSSSDFSDYELLKTKLSVSCNKNKPKNADESGVKESRRKRVIRRSLAKVNESVEEISSDEEIPIVTTVRASSGKADKSSSKDKTANSSAVSMSSDSSDYELLKTKNNVSCNKNKPKNADKPGVKESRRKRVIRRSSAKVNESVEEISSDEEIPNVTTVRASSGKADKSSSKDKTANSSAVSMSSDSSDYELLKTKNNVSCNKNKPKNADKPGVKESHRKSVIKKSSAKVNESVEEISSDEEIPIVTTIRNIKVTSDVEGSFNGLSKSIRKTPVKEKYSKNTKADNSYSVDEEMCDNTKKGNSVGAKSPDAVEVKKNQNECTPKHKLTTSDLHGTTEKHFTPTTPSSRRPGFKRQLCTPSMPICKRDFGTPSTPLQQAMTKLHVSAVPQSLPCRESEFANVHRFLEGKILDSAGGCIYISGVPGTGKTATVREVVRSLKQDVQESEIPDFQFIEINGMRLSHPRQAYVQLWKALANETVTAEQAQKLLERKFTKSSNKQIPIVLLVDEVDVLWTKRQDVVYNLLDWPTKAKSHLVVITIANTMDLPERLLMGRVTSRLGLTRLTFQPYTHKQLEEIVKARLRGINAFDPDAIQFVSRKVASVSGDARRALDICRRATEIAEQESPDALVTIKHVDEAMVAMTSSHSVQAIVHACSTMEKLFLRAVEAELTRTGLEETTFCKAFKMMETLCSLEGLKLPSTYHIMKACMKLSSMRLLLSQHSNMDIYTRIFLNVSADDLHYALKCTRKEL